MNKEELKKDPSLIDFLDSRDIREPTKISYINRLNEYCKFTGKMPSELIEEAEIEEEERIRMRNRQIKRYLIDFIKYLKKENRSPNYINSMLSTIRSFYSSMEIELPHVTCNIKEPDQLVTINDIPTKKHIRIALKHSNIKYRAIILLMMSSGMGSSEIRHLTLNDYLQSLKITDYDLSNKDEFTKKLKENENEIPTWSIRRYKTNMPYVTFSSPESVKAINDYIDERYEKGKKFKSINDCLFESRGKHIGKIIIVAYFSRLNDLCGFGFSKRQRFFKAHALRKFFATTLKNNGMDNLTSEWLIGHKINSITNAYIKPDIYRLKKDYLDILPFLSLEKIGTKTVESDEYKELKNQYEIDSKAKEEEMAKMKRELNLVKDMLINKGVRKELDKR